MAQWLAANEAVLSSGAAIVVMGGLLFTLLGAGIRAAMNRRRPNGANASGAPEPAKELVPAVSHSAASPNRFSVAVLPFNNLSDDVDQEYLADGLTEDVITGLSLDSRLFVIARNSTYGYKGKSPDIREVGRELGVRYVVEGSLRRRGNDLRITAQLIETDSGTHVWADKVDHAFAEIFAAQDDITNRIVGALCAQLNIAEQNRFQRARPESLEAWELCVRAQIGFLSATSASLAEARHLLEQATAVDPDYALGWAQLGYIQAMQVLFGNSKNPEEDIATALAVSERASQLAPADPVVMAYRGAVLVHGNRAEEGLAKLRRSIERNPNFAPARLAAGSALINLGRPEEALVELDRFLQQNPRDPLSHLVHYYRARTCLSLGDAEAAAAAARAAIDENAGLGGAWINLAMALFELGREFEIADAISEVRRLEPGWALSGLQENTLKSRHTPESRDRANHFYDFLREKGIWTD